MMIKDETEELLISIITLFISSNGSYLIEGVQRRATKMIPSWRNLSYEERLKKLGMFSLRRRRLRDDVLEVFKMIHGIVKVNLGKLFCTDEDGRTRKHSLCLEIGKHVNSNIGLNFFSLRDLLIIGTTFQI